MAEKKPRPIVYRSGDIVEIVEPEAFVRCGYPKTLKEETHVVHAARAAAIQDFLYDNGGGRWSPTCKTVWTIAKELAYARLRTNGFGEPYRKIYTEPQPDLLGEQWTVIDKKVVKTGRYHSPSGYGEDYEPGELSLAQSHVILHLQTVTGCPRRVWIEAKHVRKVEVDNVS